MVPFTATIRRFGSFRALLCGGVSLLAMGVVVDQAAARNLGTPVANSPAQAAVAAQQQAAAQAAAAAATAQASLARAAAALAAARKAQQDAAAAVRAGMPAIPNGVASGGLMPSGGVTPDSNCGTSSCTYQLNNSGAFKGADPNLVQTFDSSSNHTTVSLTQRDQKAIYNWESLNVGRDTLLRFDQGGSDWIAFNRVAPNISPTYILGQISAKGGVYVINRNGIIFGGGSQINVHALVASTLDVGGLGLLTQDARDTYFLNTGIGNTTTSNPFSFSIFDPVNGAKTTERGGDVVVEAGAKIKTDIVDLDSPGYVFLFAKNVTNAGTITVPAGEVAMVAARSIEVLPNGIRPDGTANSVYPTQVLPQGTNGIKFRGTEFLIQRFSDDPTAYNADGSVRGGFFAAGTGIVTHQGLIETPRGIVVMTGDQVNVESQAVISADTSISRNSMVLLRAATAVAMNGTISVLPFDDGNTLPLSGGSGSESTVQSFMPAYVEMKAQNKVTMGSSALISAPSASVALKAASGFMSDLKGGLASPINTQPGLPPQLTQLDTGATIDVAGLQDVVLPASYNFVKFQPRAEFADMPLQRDGVLYGETLWIDIRATGTRSDGTTWVGTPVGDASGVVGAVGRSIYQLMTSGGNVSLSTDQGTTIGAASVVLQSGSVINVAGGKVRFLPGTVPITRLVGIDGRIYSMENADPNMTYVGIAGRSTVDHARWGLKETWATLTQSNQPGYVEGHDAGGVSISTVTPTIGSNARLIFGSVIGERQAALGRAPSNKFDLTSGTSVERPTPLQAKGDELPSQGYLKIDTLSSMVIRPNGSTAESANFRSESTYRTVLSAETLSGYGLSLLSMTADDLAVTTGSNLTLAAGGAFSAKTRNAIDIAGTISAAGGKISLSTNESGTAANTFTFLRDEPNTKTVDVFIGGTLDVSGRWVNDTGRIGLDVVGPGFIDGGSISIITTKSNLRNPGDEDTSGSIRLASGSLLDVSSGGYISPAGKAKTVAPGVMAGKGGSISLLLYQGTDWNTPGPPGSSTPDPVRPSTGTLPVLQLDGQLRAFGFEQNGTLRLGAVDTIRIGGTLQAGERSVFTTGTLPVELLTGGGFGAFILETVPDKWTGATAQIVVSSGVNLTLQQRNLSSGRDYRGVATDSKIAAIAGLDRLPDDQRRPVDLTLKANNILIDTGARLVTDPKATITMAGSREPGQPNVFDRERRANSVVIRGSIIDHAGTVKINAETTWLGPQAKVDLSGTFVRNSRFGQIDGPVTSGTLLSGGTFAVEGAQPGDLEVFTPAGVSRTQNPGLGGTYVVAEAGAELDVSGYAGVIEVQSGLRSGKQSVWSWSDAGNVSTDVGGFAWGGTFKAAGGDPRANNGTIILGGGNVTLQQSAPSGTAVPNSIIAAVDQLAAFDNIFLYAGSSIGGAGRIFTDMSTDVFGNRVSTYGIAQPSFSTLTVNGDVSKVLADSRLHIAAAKIESTTGSTVNLEAAYVLLTGGGGTPSTGTGTFNLKARTIDIEGAAFAGFNKVQFTSTGDIRLSTPKVANGVITAVNTLPNDPATFAGKLALRGDLVMDARRIYPVSAVDFTIETNGNVTFQSTAGGRTDVPLSAGGSLTVIASTIDQNGFLFAPLGKITLGNLDPTVSPIITSRVTLGPGSLTSVTLDGSVVPYGETPDGTNWYYNAANNPLGQPPAKGLVLAGTSVDVSADSTVDLRGGGDLQAMNWIQGKGGSRDTLAKTTNGRTIYALIPSSADEVAAFDIHFTTARSSGTLGDAYPLAGQQITIDGGGGIPAGTYTLYPAHYATLPGALRVTYYGDNLGRNVPSGSKLPDGTVLVTGHYTQSTAPQKQSSGESLFAVQTGTTWRQYSEYEFNRANDYFAAKAGHDGTNVPRLPMDAGRLAVVAQQQIELLGKALTSQASGGRGGELDISGLKLALVSHDEFVAQTGIPAGFVGVDVAQTNAFESVLIGGRRFDQADGTTLITAIASDVIFHTPRDADGKGFTASELILVATPSGGSGGSISILSGSVIETAGVPSNLFARSYKVGTAGTTTTAPGAIVVATQDSRLTVAGPTGTGPGRVSIADNVRIVTDTLTVQATAATDAIRINTNDIHARQLNLGAQTIAVGVSSPSAVTDKSLVLGSNAGQFADVHNLALKALSGPISLYGDFDVGATMDSLTLDAQMVTRAGGAGNATVTVVNGTLTLVNSGAAGSAVGESANGSSLNLLGKAINLDGGSQTIADFSTVNWTAADRVLVGKPGSLTLGTGADKVDLTVTTPAIVVAGATASGSGSFAITTLGAASIGLPSGQSAQVPTTNEFGGNFSLTAASIDHSGVIQARAGSVTLQATTGDVTLGAGSYIAAGGYRKTLVDSDVFVPGGKVVLKADAGNIATHATSVIDVEAAKDARGERQGYGGEIDVIALNGAADLQGSLRGGGGPGLGGRFKLDTKGRVDLSALAPKLLDGGLTGAIDIHTRTGNLILAPDRTLKAHQVILTADDPAEFYGYVIIGGTIDADGYAGKTADGSGQAGGQVALFGRNSVRLTSTAQIRARTGGTDVEWAAGDHSLPSKIVWFNDGTGSDTVAFSSSGRYTTDGGATFTTFAANAEISLPKNSAVVLDAPGSVRVRGQTTVRAYAVAHDDERGGDVIIGTAWNARVAIDLQGDDAHGRSKIDVSGGMKGGLLGGTVTLRAPLDGNNDVKIFGLNSTISGARAVNVQAFATINTQASPNNVNGLDGSALTASDGTHVKWDGYIDPAGAVTSNGTPVDFGSWTNLSGSALSTNPGSGYTAPPVITVSGQSSTAVTINGATYQEVVDAVTGTRFRSSLQVVSGSVTNGGEYDSRPTIQVVGQPGFGVAAQIGNDGFNMGYKNLVVTTTSTLPPNGVPAKLFVDGVPIGTGTVVTGSGQFSLSAINLNPGVPGTLNKLPTSIQVCLPAATCAGLNLNFTTGITGRLTVTSIPALAAAARGYGYALAPSIQFSGGGANAIQATVTANMGATLTVIDVTKGYTGTTPPTPTFAPPQIGVTANATFSQQVQTGLTGTTNQAHVFTPDSNFIPSAASRVFGGQGDGAAVLTVSPNQEHRLLYTDTLANFVQGNGLGGFTGYGFSGLLNRLNTGPNSLVAQLGANVVHVQPGIELVNTGTANGGNITVASNWNLAAGTAGNLQGGKYSHVYETSDASKQSYVKFDYRLATPWGGLDAGALTLRAAGNIDINASISDGFFQFRDYLDAGYQDQVKSYLSQLGNSNLRGVDWTGTITPATTIATYNYYLNSYKDAPIAPYKAGANVASPTSVDLAVADLFPNQLRVCTANCTSATATTTVITNPTSWSYRVTAGADTASANPGATVSLQQASLKGDVTINKSSSYTQSLYSDQGSASNPTIKLPTMVRTGTGDIAIMAARDVRLTDPDAPGVIYAAGVNAPRLAPAYDGSAATPTVVNANGFLEPQVLALSMRAEANKPVGVAQFYGPPTAAAFPHQGGDVDVEAQRDIIGYSGATERRTVYQYFSPWLLSQTELTPATNASDISVRGQGVFAPTSASIASQTAWWIQYGSFQQGILSAGGNVRVVAGRDIKDVSVSLPTTGRVSGGLAANSTPVTHIYDSGNMTVRAGRDILGGAFYEGSGHASIVAGRNIGQNGTIVKIAGGKELPNVPLLAVDLGQISMVAGGSLSFAGVVNPAELHAQKGSLANPFATPSGQSNANYPLFMDTYGPESAATVMAVTGDVNIRTSPTAITDFTIPGKPVRAASAQTYPASFEAVALSGNITTAGIIDQPNAITGQAQAWNGRMPGIVLSGSEHGTFGLLAEGSIDLTFGYRNGSNSVRPFISAGPALLNKAYDPFRPNAWAGTHEGDASYGGAFGEAVLAHQDNASGSDALAKIYAVTGDIVAAGAYGANDKKTIALEGDLYQGGYARVEINRPAKVYAGNDIVDLNLIVQNIEADDVSTVAAGRDIRYTGWNNAGGLQVAGPGFLVVQAGRDLGPFLPAAHNNKNEALVQEGIVSVANDSRTPVGNVFISAKDLTGGASIGIYDPLLLGGYASDRPATQRNPLLPKTGAELLVMFGVAPPLPAGSNVVPGLDAQIAYQAVIDKYIDPRIAGTDHKYLAELKAFLAQIGRPVADEAAAWATFNSADFPTDLKHVFVDKVFFAELKAVGIGITDKKGEYQRGYRMVNTMFPASYGYTENALTGGANGANVLKHWGDLEMFHATMQTRFGGEVSIFGPSGTIRVGSLATEINSNLKLRDLGILTLGGGAINTFTDQHVLVNSSRVLTTQGGDVLMWTSNGDLNAGRGSKTTLSFPPLEAVYDSDAFQSVDLGGFVTGAGIGTLKTSALAATSSVYLLAPRGTIDFGTAGARCSLNCTVDAPKIANPGNIEAGGKVTGVPTVTAPPVAALTSASETAGASTKTTDTSTASGGNRERASVFIVEVIGYGGGDAGGGQPRPAGGEQPRIEGGEQTRPEGAGQTRDAESSASPQR